MVPGKNDPAGSAGRNLNRVGLIDWASTLVEGEDRVDLNSGNDYRIVTQAGRDAEPGLAGIALRGPGASPVRAFSRRK